MKKSVRAGYTFGHIEIGPRARKLLKASLARNWVSGGPNVKLFEQKFRKTFGFAEAVSVASGTSACITQVAALHEYGADWGDEVIVPALSFVATANSVLAAGFRPVFVDIQRDTLNIDPEKIEKTITKRTRAIQVVHTMGKPCDMDPILDIAKRRKLIVLEDACEAHGGRYKGKYVGGIGRSGAFSFYAAHIICSGEGGMVTTNDPEFAKILRSVRSHGRPDGTIFFQFDRFGINAKMNDLEAAVGVEGIENFQRIFAKRKENLQYLLAGVRDLSDRFYFLNEEPYEVISPHAFPLVIREKAGIDYWKLYRHLEEKGMQVKTLFASLPTQHKCFRFLGYREGAFPEAEYVGKNGLHVGCHQYLRRTDLDYFLEVLHDYARQTQAIAAGARVKRHAAQAKAKR